MQAKIAKICHGFMDPETLVRVALKAASRNPDLLRCTLNSYLVAFSEAREYGIQPTGTAGRGYLVPRKNTRVTPNQWEVSFDPGYKGLIDIAARSDIDIESAVVFENDEFRLELGLNPVLVHVPNMTDGERGGVKGVYAIATFANGRKKFRFTPRAYLDKIKKSAASQNGPWSTWEEPMYEKTGIKQLCKTLPFKSALLEKALVKDDESDAPFDLNVEDPAALPAESMAAALPEPNVSRKLRDFVAESEALEAEISLAATKEERKALREKIDAWDGPIAQKSRLIDLYSAPAAS
jgi:recombination protein RecT